MPPAPLSTGISAVGKQCLILFYVMKCGTMSEDTDVLNFTCKLMPHGAGLDDGDDYDDEASRAGGSARK